MKRSDEREEQKQRAREGLEGYLRGKGIDTAKPFRCLNPAHEDRHPSMAFDERRHRVHCFACGQDYDIFDLVGMDFGLAGFNEQLARALEVVGISVPVKARARPRAAAKRTEDVPAYLQACRKRLSGTDYPARRGLSPETCARFGLGYDPAFAPGGGRERWQALIIPTGEGSFTARNTDAGADKRSRIRKQGESAILAADALFGEGPPAFVVEGELDALSIYEVGGEAVSLGSTANVQRFLRLMEAKRPQRTLLIAMDADDSGQAAAQALCEGLGALGIAHHRVSLGEGVKDANDALLSDREGFAALVTALAAMERDAEAAERAAYEDTCLLGAYDAFLSGLSGAVDTPCWPTGFAQLDRHLDGGLYEGLYVVGAISSLGKTTLALQMADQIAAGGRDVLLFSLEMSRRELLSKSLSRMTLVTALAQRLDTGFAKTPRGILAASRWASYSVIDKKLLEDAAGAYRPATRCLYVHEGMGDVGPAGILEAVQKHIRFTGRTPVVMIDYLQILAPISERATDKQNMDRAVLALKRISRDLSLPLIAISSFNRASYREAVTMEAFKESGAIEYSSDVLIGLQLKGAGKQGFDPTEEKERDPRQVELVILKNRSGPAGRRVAFDYYPRFNYFKEQPMGLSWQDA